MRKHHLISILCITFTFLSGAAPMTIRELLKTHLEQVQTPSDTDIFLAKLSNVDHRLDDRDNLDFLRDVLKYVPRTHPTVINTILDGEGVGNILDSLLDLPYEDLLDMLIGNVGQCLSTDGNNECYENALRMYSDKNNKAHYDPNTTTIETTTIHPGREGYEQCSKDLKPIYSPIIYAVFEYLENMIADVKKNLKRKWGRDLTCQIAMDVAIDKIKPLKDIFYDSRKWTGWELKFLDYLAKPPAAITGGQLQWVGGYEMCHKINVSLNVTEEDSNGTRSLGGRYCRIKIGEKAKNEPNASKPLPINLGIGICFPDSCTQDSVIDYISKNPGILSSVLSAVGLEVKNVFCGNELDFATDSRAQTAFGIIAALVILAVLATLYDLAIRPSIIHSWAPLDSYQSTIEGMKYNQSQTDLQMNPVSNGHANGNIPGPDLKAIGRQSSVLSTNSLLHSMNSVDDSYSLGEKASVLNRMEAAFAGFSAAVSLRKIFDVRNLTKHHIPSIDGVRFLSVIYALGGNTCLFGILYTESITAGNLVDKLLELPHMFAFQPVINYSLCADSFLVVSGVMVAYHWLRRLDKADGKLSFKQIIHFYLHRYWSLMPVMMLVIMTYTCLYKYLLSGPLSPPQIQDAENCRVNWWVNMLMLGNLVQTDTTCLAWTWYIPLLFQLHIITPIILIPLSYKRWAGWLSLGVMYTIFISTVSGVVKEHIYGDSLAWYKDYIQTPWCRAGPYFIGVAVGILLYDKVIEKIPRNIGTKLLSYALWVVTLGIILLCAFITYTKYRKDDPVKWTEDQTVAYHVFIRSVWGLAIAYIILACQSGYGGIFNSVLSQPAMTQASRLALPVLVVHAIFIFKYAYSQFDPIYINFTNLLYIFFGHIIMNYLIAMALGMIFFFPFQGLEYAFFGAKTKLDIITAGSCDQSYRDIKKEHDEEIERMRNYIEPTIDYDGHKTRENGVSFM